VAGSTTCGRHQSSLCRQSARNAFLGLVVPGTGEHPCVAFCKLIEIFTSAANVCSCMFVLTATLPQGARIGKGVYIDSLDFTDLELVNIGDETVVNEGVSIVGHYFKDGCLHFGQVGGPTRIFHSSESICILRLLPPTCYTNNHETTLHPCCLSTNSCI
jgi:hypothetical protein